MRSSVKSSQRDNNSLSHHDIVEILGWLTLLSFSWTIISKLSGTGCCCCHFDLQKYNRSTAAMLTIRDQTANPRWQG